MGLHIFVQFDYLKYIPIVRDLAVHFCIGNSTGAVYLCAVCQRVYICAVSHVEVLV